MNSVKRNLAIILGFGFVSRLLFLGERQLWVDELMQALVLRAPSFKEMMTRLREGMAIPAPLDYCVQRLLVLAFGDSTWILRLHAVIFGTLSLWFFFRIARRLFGDRVALYATALLTIYPLHYHYSQEGRPYALFLCLTLFSYDLLLQRISEQRKGWLEWSLLGAVNVLLLYSSFLGLLVILTQFLTLLASAAGAANWLVEVKPESLQELEAPDFPKARWSQAWTFSIVAACAILVYVPWLRFAWESPHVAGPSEILHPKILLRLIKELGDNSYPMSAIVLLGAWTGFRALKRHARRETLVWIVCWAAVSLPALIVLEIWSGYFFAIRHILHCTPALILLAGYGLSFVGERLTILDRAPYRMSAPTILYASVALLISAWIAQSHWRSEIVDWRGTAKELESTARPGEVITMPKIYVLLEYYAPSLEAVRVDDLDPGLGFLERADIRRRTVVCLNQLTPDPCGGFRARALKDSAWRKREVKGFTIFSREK